MNSAEDLVAVGRRQERLCADNGSPTYAQIISAIVERIHDRSEAAVELLYEDPRPAIESALFLRLLGAVHRLVLAGDGCGLERCYPSAGGELDAEGATSRFFPFVDAKREVVAQEMQVAVQTNDVGRSGVISAGLRYIAGVVGRPLRLLEVGASAGLNLWCDRYFVDAGCSSWGPPESSVRLTGLFREGCPGGTEFTIVERAGCDLAPVDALSDRGRAHLRSFIWPEDLARLSRLDAALSIFPGAELQAADATEWIEGRLDACSGDVATVVFHSIVMPYLARGQRDRVQAAIETAGQSATGDRPLAWLRLEPLETQGVVVSLDLWPHGLHLTLARCSPHGAEIVWKPDQ